MSAFLPPTPGGPGGSPDRVTRFDPRRSRATVRRRWELRSAEWRAVEIAESVFGSVEGPSMSGGLDGPFRGILDLSVPFSNLEEHRSREARFAAAAGLDPVLARVPLVFVFTPLAEDAAVDRGQRAPRGKREARRRRAHTEERG